MAVLEILGSLKRSVSEVPIHGHVSCVCVCGVCVLCLRVYFYGFFDDYFLSLGRTVGYSTANCVFFFPWGEYTFGFTLQCTCIMYMSHCSPDTLCLFALQESWDYIGSSRMIYDMERGAFPDDVGTLYSYLSHLPPSSQRPPSTALTAP